MAADADSALVREETPAPGITLLTLALPQLRNAMTTDLTAAWTSAIDRVAADPAVRAVVVTGEGSVFCAGADLSWLDQGQARDNTPDRMRERMLPFYRSWLAPRDLAVPVIAALNGPAIGAGLCLALACDLRYASRRATFRAPFTALGTHGGMAAGWLLPEAIGMTRAREMLYTGRETSASEALEWGLVNGVSDDPLSQSIAVARLIADAAPIATRLTKAGLAQAPRSFEAALQWEALAQPVTMSTQDIHEGILALRGRRQPRFQGR